MLLQRLIRDIVVGNHQDRQIHIDIIRDLQVAVLRRPVTEDQTAPWALRAEEREDFGVCWVDGDVGSVEL